MNFEGASKTKSKYWSIGKPDLAGKAGGPRNPGWPDVTSGPDFAGRKRLQTQFNSNRTVTEKATPRGRPLTIIGS
jgi:hypothetical protein